MADCYWWVDYVVLLPDRSDREKSGALRLPAVPNPRAVRALAAMLSADAARWRGGQAEERAAVAASKRWLRMGQLLSRNPKVMTLLLARPTVVRQRFETNAEATWDPRAGLNIGEVWVSRSAGLWGARMNSFDYGVEFGLFQNFDAFDAFVINALPQFVGSDAKRQSLGMNSGDIREWPAKLVSVGNAAHLRRALDVLPNAFPVKASVFTALGQSITTSCLVVSERPALGEATSNPEVAEVVGGVVAHGSTPWTQGMDPIAHCANLPPSDRFAPKAIWRPGNTCSVAAIPPARIREVPGTAMFVGPANSWYHFLVEGLAYAPDVLEVSTQSIPVVMSASAPFQLAQASHAIAGCAPIFVAPYEGVRVERLLLSGTSSPQQRPPLTMDAVRLRKLSQRLRSIVSLQREQRTPGIFIRRWRGQLRPLQNSQVLYRQLEREGFIGVDPGRMSLAEQIRTFASTPVVIAESGAALTNLMFCAPATRLVEVVPHDTDHSFWPRFAAIFDVQHRRVVAHRCVMGASGLATDGMRVDVDAVLRAARAA